LQFYGIFSTFTGGGFKEETDRPYKAEVCVFTCEADLVKMKCHVQIIRNLTRRFKYLTKTFEESMIKILKFLKGFTVEERTRLAVYTGLVLAEGLVAGTILTSLLNENLVKEGLALTFLTKCFAAWLSEKDIASVGQVLRKGKLDFKLLVGVCAGACVRVCACVCGCVYMYMCLYVVHRCLCTCVGTCT